MIAYLKGTILSKSKDHIVLLVDNIGYQVFVPIASLGASELGEFCEFYTYEHVREDTRDLFGFPQESQLGLFKDLIKVNGVGPKMALNVLSLGAEKVRASIMAGEVGILSSVSGVGKKTAQKIVLELKGVLSDAGISEKDSDTIEALKRLGYSQQEALDALKEVAGETPEEKIHEALKRLGKR